MKKVTPFQKKVFDATSKIPKGKISTYKLIANFIKCRSAQAVGQALKRNPFAPVVPCHRVISSNLTIGGFGGETSGKKIREKVELLKSEGVKFKNGKIADESMVFNFGDTNER